jgi:CRP-like cAMP-binding protein
MSAMHSGLSLFVNKLKKRSEIPDAAIEAFLRVRVRRLIVSTYQDVIREGERTTHCCLVEQGLVSRYRTLRDGGRQILSFHLPGDMADLHASLLMISDHGIRAHIPTTIVQVPCIDMLRLAAEFPELGRAFWFDTLVDAGIFREWTVSVGRRSARRRIGHLLLEFACRYQAIGESDGTRFELRVIQADLADAAGLSLVHVKRSLQALRAEGLIRTYGKTVVIEDWDALAELADFNPSYLHPEGPRPIGAEP